MVNKIKIYFFPLLCLLLFSACNKSKDEYYAEPSWLDKPLYEVLQNEGNFKSYLACIDRTLYAPQLKEGGYFTLMAPNDEAFSAYLNEKGYTSVDDIPIEEVNKIIAYSIIQSYWLSENLGDIFTGTVDDRYDIGDGLKKQTYYYATVYKDSEYDNRWVIDQNSTSTSFNTTTNNFKYYPVFMQTYFAKANLTAIDYNTFFPNTQYIGGQTVETGMIGNVYNGQIVKPNLKARNGIAHEVSVVGVPLDNMDKFLREDQYNTFKSLLDFKDVSGSYVYKNYIEDATQTEKYKLLRPNDAIDKVYVKSYNTSGLQPLSFSPALELIYDDNRSNLTQSNGYTLFVPSNDALTNYINNRLLKYYHSLSDLPIEAITTLINTHMVNSMIWPSQLKTSQVSTGEYINGQGALGNSYDNFGVTDKKFASNGFIYTIDHVIKSKLFETIYSGIYLNPSYTNLDAVYRVYYNLSLRQDLMKSIITGYPNVRYTLLMISNDQFANDGFTYNSETATFSNSSLVSTTVSERIRRLTRTHLFDGWVDNNINSEVNFTDGISEYGGYGFRNTDYGDVVRYKNNQLQASGNIEENTFVNITKNETFDNGTVYTIDKMLQYSKRESSPTTSDGWNSGTLWHYIQQTAQENSNVSMFADYVQYALKTTSTDALLGISEDNFYTIVMPNNNAIIRAQAAKDLPSLDSLKLGTLSQERVDMCVKFVQTHFLQGYAFPDDRLPYMYPYNINSPNKNIVSTMYRITNEPMKLFNQHTNIVVSKDASGSLTFTPDDVYIDGKLIIKGNYGLPVPVPRIITGTAKTGNNGYRSNRICGRSIHHEYTNYFKFTVQN
ncbi:conserved exported hypothetical protein [uncultured Paludibacter sp.]|uniref:FAS1 domain-containing protein n=1 Tax=uncultured Paludibacter sp. TaxID=497635 RepID=A0A653AIY3_9BACT|nr:conserved exported hypothetical protein [uncultured Paludibacter sp.]